MQLAARIGMMEANWIQKTTITIASDTTNMAQVSDEIRARLAEIGIESAVVSYPKDDYSEIDNRFLEGVVFLGSTKAANPIRFRNGSAVEAQWGSQWDGIVHAGDIYDVYQIQLPQFARPWDAKGGGGY